MELMEFLFSAFMISLNILRLIFFILISVVVGVPFLLLRCFVAVLSIYLDRIYYSVAEYMLRNVVKIKI